MLNKDDLTEYALEGYNDYEKENPNIKTSPAWYGHEIGRHLQYSGRNKPSGVRMGRGYQIWANDMLFAFGKSNEITRVK